MTSEERAHRIIGRVAGGTYINQRGPIDVAISGVLGWHIDDKDLPAQVQDDHNTVIGAARNWRDLLPDEAGNPPEHHVDRSSLILVQVGGVDIVEARRLARLVLAAITEDTK